MREKNFVALAAVAVAPLLSFAQTQPAEPDSPFVTAVITWLPFLGLIALWFFFMRRMNVFGKGGYRDYMRVSQEKLTQMEVHLADIAKSLRQMAERGERL